MGEIETQGHAMICLGWAEQRDRLDLSNMSKMVVFFRWLLDKKDGKNTDKGLP